MEFMPLLLQINHTRWIVFTFNMLPTFEQISEIVDLDIETISELNPVYRMNVIPAYDKPPCALLTERQNSNMGSKRIGH